MDKQNKDILTMLDDMTDEELWEKLNSCDYFGLTELFHVEHLQNRIKQTEELKGTVILKGDDKFEGFEGSNPTTIGLYDQLPSPTSTEDVVRKGYGSYYEVYSPTLVNDELVWKKVAWSY
ncbi:hypothetical protein vBVpaMR16F_154 [Vibrio phage vB_VpaM_R16F]|nr:hypothetical protein vBVpaMR16F_154 [Vibrio phage vB_VpaM_R16F]